MVMFIETSVEFTYSSSDMSGDTVVNTNDNKKAPQIRMPKDFWNVKTINDLLAKKKFKSRSQWKKEHQSTYVIAQRQGCFEALCEQHGLPKKKAVEPVKWTKAAIIKDIRANKWKVVTEWAKGNSSSYTIATRNHWLAEIMDKAKLKYAKDVYVPKEYSYTEMLHSASQYPTKQEWRKAEPGLYKRASQQRLEDRPDRRVLDDITEVVWGGSAVKTGYSDKDIIEIAKDFGSKQEFAKGKSYLYKIACKRKCGDTRLIDVCFPKKPK